jgi:hypothetical protein
MRIEILTKLVQNTKRDKKWLHELQEPLRFRVTGVSMPECDVLCDDFMIGFIRDGVLEITKGYAHDGLTCWPDTETNREGGIIHDFGYQTKLWPRAICDKMIQVVLESKGDEYSNVVYAGVRSFGWMFYGKHKNITIKYL